MSYMTEKEYNIIIGKLLANASLNDEEANRFANVLQLFESLLDDGDQEDVYGTEGWRRHLGWED